MIENPCLDIYSLSQGERFRGEAPSTMHAEFVACHETTQQAIWLKKFVPDLKVVDSIQNH